MAYIVTYDDDYLFDPYTGDDSTISDASISEDVNASAYFDFTIPSTHHLYNTIEERAGIVKVYSDSKLLFMGEIIEIEEDFYGSKSVSCVDPRDHLNDVIVRPYSTIEREQQYVAPSSVDGYFQWLVDQYNKGAMNPKFRFDVDVNQGAYLDKNNYIYRFSEDFPTVGAEIQDKILDALGGYLTLTYPNGVPTLNLYADVHEANTQIIDFGANLVDFTKTTGTDSQYTAIRPEGGTPDKEESDSDNLISGTRDWSDGRGLGYRTSNKYDGFYILEHAAEDKQVTDAGVWTIDRVEAEKQYTLSFYMWTDTPGIQVYSYLYPSAVKSGTTSQSHTTTSSDGKILTTPDTNRNRYWITWTTLDEIDSEIEEFHLIVSRLDHQKDGARVYIAGVKFEENSTATPWSPASSDDGPPPVTIESLGDGVTNIDSDYIKFNDVVYCASAVQRYGYKEYNWQEGDTLDPQELLEKAVADLKKCVEPKLTLEVKAVDMALFMDGYDHLECGQVARVRSTPHGVDEYLLVSSMEIDLQDPSQTTYTLGQAFDSLTGEQSSFVKSLNAGINSSLDAVAGLTQDVKDNAIKIDGVGNAVTEVGNKADNAINLGNQANQAAQEAWDKANSAENAAQNAADAVEEVRTWIDDYEDTVNDVTEVVNKIQISMGETEKKLTETAEKAQSASDKADALVETVDEVNTTIEGLNGEIDGLKVTVDAAKSTAESAVNQVAQTQTDLDGFKTSVSQNYSTKKELDDAIAQEVLDRDAALKVGLEGISATVSENYTELTEKVSDAQSDASTALEAAKSASEDLTNFTNEITGSLGDLQSQIDGSIQTWFYAGVPTLANKPASDWTTSELLNNHLGDLYYDTSTGYAYRFMVQNGTYSWGRITDSDVTKALQNASKAQDTADAKRRVFVTTPTPPYDVGDLWVQGSGGDIKRCQTAKTASQSYAAADWILASKYTDDTKANAVENALNSYKTTVANTYSTKAELTTTKNSILAEVSESYTSKEVFEGLEIGGNNLIQDSRFIYDYWVYGSGLSVDTTTTFRGYNTVKVVGSGLAEVRLAQKEAYYPRNVVGKSLTASIYVMSPDVSAVSGKINLTIAYRDSNHTANGSSFLTITSSDLGNDNEWNRFTYTWNDDKSAQYYCTLIGIFQSLKGTVYVALPQLEFGNKATAWSIAPEDFQKELDDSIAQEVIDRNAAIKVESTAIQQSVSQKYATKDALADTNASITTTKDNILSQVSATYATRDELSKANLIKNPDFHTNTTNWTSENGSMSRGTDANLGTYASFTTATRFYYNFPASQGQIWTAGVSYEYSFMAKCNTTGGTLRPSRSIKDYSATTHAIGTTWKKFSGIIECKATVASGGTLSFTTNGNSRTFYVTDVYLAPLDYTSINASQAYVDQKADSITSTVESNYNSLNNKFGSYYTKTQIDQQKTSIESSIKVAVGDIKVGSTNILLKTQTFDTSTSTLNGAMSASSASKDSATYENLTVRKTTKSGTTLVTIGQWFVAYPTIRYGKQFTLSFYVKGSTSTKVSTFFYGPSGYVTVKRVTSSDNQSEGGYGDGNTSLSVTTTWTRVWVTWELNTTGNDLSIGKYVLIRNDAVASGATVYVCGVKLEEGNKPTDWSPAPEDVETELTSIRQDLDSIDLKVKDLDGNQSDFQVTVDGFEARLKTAESNATTAKNNASTAVNTANTANSTASSAKTTATNAQTTANTANTTANSAKTTATNAQNTANTALTNTKPIYDWTGQLSSATYVRILRSNKTHTDNGNSGYAHIWGAIGDYGGAGKGSFDITVSFRETATVVLNQKDSKLNTAHANILVYRDSSGYINVYLYRFAGYSSNTIYAQGRDYSTTQATGSPSGTKIFDLSSETAEPAKTATNYLKFDSTGLTVGNVSGTLQGNTRMTSSAVEIRNGTTVLSSFGASTIELGKNSSSSIIKLCGGKGQIQYSAKPAGTAGSSSNGLNIVSNDGVMINGVPVGNYPIGSIIFIAQLTYATVYTPEMLGLPGTWQRCAMGISGMRSPYLALDNWADDAGTNMRQNTRTNSMNQKFWFDLYPNAGNGNRLDCDIWVRTA